MLSQSLMNAATLMKEHNTPYLFVGYFGHAVCKSADGPTRISAGESMPPKLERSIRDAKIAAGMADAMHLVIADCCQELLATLSGDSEEECPDSSNWLYSSKRFHPSGDTGHFAAVLAYCLLKRPQTLQVLFSQVKEQVQELSFFRQLCCYPHDLQSIKLFPAAASSDVQTLLPEHRRQDFEELLHDLYFASRHLCELSGNELRCAEPYAHSHAYHFEQTRAKVKQIVEQLDVKRGLFLGDSWFLQLELAYYTDSLDKVLGWLREIKKPLPPSPRAEFPVPHPVSEEIQRCLLDALKDSSYRVRDEFDVWDQAKPNHVQDAAHLWVKLCQFFKFYDGKLLGTDTGCRCRYTYAIFVPGVRIVEDAELPSIGKEINGLCQQFGIKLKVFLVPGSLWIIIRSAERLQERAAFMQNLTKFVESLRRTGSRGWRNAEAPYRVPLHTLPAGLLHMVQQLEDGVQPGGVLWLRAADVQLLMLQHLNRQKAAGDQLHHWQVTLFEGMFEARPLQWTLGCMVWSF